MKLTIDFETRSAADIKKVGAWKYSQDPSTEPLCLAIKTNDNETGIWIPGKIADMIPIEKLQALFSNTGNYLIVGRDIAGMVSKADTIEAHNVFFERSIWENIMIPKYGWPEIHPRKWRCSAAKASVFALPRSLEGAGAALKLKTQKDDTGHRLMLKMCKPRTPLKKEKEANPDWENTTYWHEKPEDFIKLFQYCIQDVEAEHALSAALRDLNPMEQEIWFLDQAINHRGVMIDIESAKASIELLLRHEISLLKELRAITHGTVETAKQVAKMRGWLLTRGVNLPDLSADSVKEALKSPLPDDAKRVLQIRRSLGKSSTGKYQAFLDRASADGRVRDTIMYHGASTGRWAGRGIQTQNFPRPKFKDADACINLVKARDFETMQLLWGDPVHALASCLRGNIIAGPGNDLIAADYSSIEGRGLAWLAGEQYILDNYYGKKCAYCVFASQVTGIPYEEIYSGYKSGVKEYEDIRFEGKTGELACGYQGGEKAVEKFAPTMDKKRRKEIVRIWRDNRPMTKTLWYDMERLAKAAVQSGKVISNRYISYAVVDNFLCCKLPSGRVISYYDPKLKVLPMKIEKDCTCGKETFDETGDIVAYFDPDCPLCEGTGIYYQIVEKETIIYMGVDTYTKQWTRQKTYGGKLVENIVQALCRDIMAEAMLRAEQAGYNIIMTVHDEIVAEIPKGFGSLKEFEDIMEVVPSWAAGMPIAAEGWRGERYRK